MQPFRLRDTLNTLGRCSKLLLVLPVVWSAVLAGPSMGAAQSPAVTQGDDPLHEAGPQEPDIDIYALMSGKCSRLKIAGRDFACRSMAYFHTKQGRAQFTIVLEDPADDGHIVSFSGENGRRDLNNVYELSIDRMLLNSRDRPKVDGLPVPRVESSAGTCKQLGNFAAARVSSISCVATDRNGKKYELQFESDGLPITVRRISQSPPTILQSTTP